MTDHEDGPPNAPARQSRPGSHPPDNGGVTIQKVEIVVTSDRNPSDIARAVEARLRELSAGQRRRDGNGSGEGGGAPSAPAPPTDGSRKLSLVTRKEALRAYLQAAFQESDWHAVSDAANDLRCVEVELRGLGVKP